MKILHEDHLDEVQLTTEAVYQGKLLKVWKDKVKLPNGRESYRELIKHPGAVGILPVLPDGSVIFVKQFRYPVSSVLYEIPAGKLEPGENPRVCAERELSEETGYTAKQWTYLTSIVTTPGFTNELIHLYVARDLTEKKQHPDADEFLHVVKISHNELKQMLLKQDIFDSKSLSALLLYLLRVKDCNL